MVVRGLTYQFTVFGAFQELSATPEVINPLMTLFKDFRGGRDILVPISIVQPQSELKGNLKSAPISILGLSFRNQSGTFHIQFNGARIDVRSISDSDNSKNGFEKELKDFNEDINFVFKQIFNKYEKKATRIALVLNLITKEISDEKIDLIFKKIFTLNDAIMNNQRLEWSFRVNNRLTGKFHDETLNSFLSFSRGNLNPFLRSPSNTFTLQTEINTIPEKRDERFSQDQVFEFYKVANEIQTEQIGAFIKHIEL